MKKAEGRPPTMRADRDIDAEAIQAIYAAWVVESAVTLESDVPCVDFVGERVSVRLAHFPWRSGDASVALHEAMGFAPPASETNAATNRKHGGISACGRSLCSRLRATLADDAFSALASSEAFREVLGGAADIAAPPFEYRNSATKKPRG